MRDEHLKGWLVASKRKKREAAEKGEGNMDNDKAGPTSPHWERLVDLIQTVFMEGDLAEEATWQAVLLIPKGKKDYRGIGLVEVMWKVVWRFKIAGSQPPSPTTTSYMDFGRVSAQVLPPSRPICSSSLRP